jgi:hypothetical protein
LAFHQQAADELRGNQLGGAGEEGWREVLGGRGGFGSGLCIIISIFFQKKTMHRPAFGLVSSLISVVVTSAPSQASPFVYTTGGLLNADLKTCMADAKRVATKTGFTEGQEDALDEDKKDGSFFASKADAPLSLAVRCFPTAGVYSLALSGVNNDTTWEEWQKFLKVFFED